ncbi:endonuclease III, partial [Streptococcus agalactiae]|nr:endonuclease III [Streptococcus agalactiae]MCD0069632.1 endonuclease III [Streptococcus agalactiae]
MLSKAKSRYIIREIIKLFPDAKPSLDFTNVFELLVAVMLSAQTTDAAVNKVTPALFERFPNPLVLAQADPKEIEPYISKIGLYRNKARFLNQCAKQL